MWTPGHPPPHRLPAKRPAQPLWTPGHPPAHRLAANPHAGHKKAAQSHFAKRRNNCFDAVSLKATINYHAMAAGFTVSAKGFMLEDAWTRTAVGVTTGRLRATASADEIQPQSEPRSGNDGPQ